jgi:hypothetical protein
MYEQAEAAGDAEGKSDPDAKADDGPIEGEVVDDKKE